MSQEDELSNGSFNNISEEELSNMSSNNDSIVQPQNAKEAGAAHQSVKLVQKEDKAYCQLCFVEFGLLKNKKHHCRSCGRSCCVRCSQMVAQSAEQKYLRMCDYCQTKQENPQLEQFYKLESDQRQKESWTVMKKIEYYKQARDDLNQDLSKLRDELYLEESKNESELKQMKKRVGDLQKEQERLQDYRSSLEKDISHVQFQFHTLEMEITDLYAVKTQNELDIYKLQTKREQKQKEIDLEVQRQRKIKKQMEEQKQMERELEIERARAEQKKRQEYYLLEESPFNVIEAEDIKTKRK